MSRPPKDKLGATPGKLALVGVLALVLVGVIASNFTGGDEPSADEVAGADKTQAPARVRTRAANTTSKPKDNPTAAGPFGEFAEDGDWPAPPMAEVIQFDPLAKAAWAMPVAAEGEVQNQARISELLAAENAIIFISGADRVARIGDEEYRIGDPVGRYVISDITPRGVVLSEK